MSGALRYFLEVYLPGSRDCWVAFEATTPFMAIAVGDIRDPNIWPGSASPLKLLRVTQVEQVVWDPNGEGSDNRRPPLQRSDMRPAHKVCLYTAEISQ